MAIGDIAGGITASISNYLQAERDRTRKQEDAEIDYQRGLIEALISRPDINPAMLGRAMHDLIELGKAKSGQRKQKKGVEGFMGMSDLPLSQFLEGIRAGTTPIHDAPQPVAPTVAAGIQAEPIVPKQSMQPKDINFDFNGIGVHAASQGAPEPSPFTGETVLQEPIAVPPPGFGVPDTAKKLVSAAQDMQKWQNRPQPLLKSPAQMGKEKGQAEAAAFGETFRNKRGLAQEFLTDPADVEMATKSALGVPVTATNLLGTVPRTYITPDGREFPGQPTKTGGIFNHNTGQVEPGALEKNEANNRLSSLYQLAASYLGLRQDSSTWSPEEAMMMQQFLLSYDGQRLAQQHGISTQYAIARAWNTPQLVRGVNAQGANVQGFGTPAQFGSGGPGVPSGGIVPMPPPGAAMQPNFSQPAQPAIAPPPVNPNGNRPLRQQGALATPNQQRPIVNPPTLGTPPQAQQTPTRGGFATDPSGNMLAPLSASVQADMQATLRAHGLFKAAKTLYDKDPKKYDQFLGPYTPAIQFAKKWTPFVEQDEPYAELAPLLGAYRDRIINSITGAQMGEQEAKRLRESLPEFTDEPAQFHYKMQTHEAVVASMAQAYASRGIPLPEPLRIAMEEMDIAPYQQPGTVPSPPMRQEIPGFPGAIAESTDGGRTWRRIQ